MRICGGLKLCDFPLTAREGWGRVKAMNAPHTFPFLLEVVGITVVVRVWGPDHIYVRTRLPLATWPYDGEQDLKFEAGRGKGEKYAMDNFPGLPVEVIKEG